MLIDPEAEPTLGTIDGNASGSPWVRALGEDERPFPRESHEPKITTAPVVQQNHPGSGLIVYLEDANLFSEGSSKDDDLFRDALHKERETAKSFGATTLGIRSDFRETYNILPTSAEVIFIEAHSYINKARQIGWIGRTDNPRGYRGINLTAIAESPDKPVLNAYLLVLGVCYGRDPAVTDALQKLIGSEVVLVAANAAEQTKIVDGPLLAQTVFSAHKAWLMGNTRSHQDLLEKLSKSLNQAKGLRGDFKAVPLKPASWT